MVQVSEERRSSFGGRVRSVGVVRSVRVSGSGFVQVVLTGKSRCRFFSCAVVGANRLIVLEAENLLVKEICRRRIAHRMANRRRISRRNVL